MIVHSIFSWTRHGDGHRDKENKLVLSLFMEERPGKETGKGRPARK